MKIVFFTHPSFMASQSMPRYAKWLSEGMRKRGHDVEIWSPEPFYVHKVPRPFKKWMGYIDQYVRFPKQVKARLQHTGENTLFVFTDHALGPWIPLVRGRKHIVHCHDFLAQRSALNEIREAKTGFTGRLYQQYIRRGFKNGKNFISISENTRKDLHRFLQTRPLISEVVYNGLTQVFTPSDDVDATRATLSAQTALSVKQGYLLHVGGNQWYKNRAGVIEIYNAWRNSSRMNLPLLMIGANPTEQLTRMQELSPYKQDIHLLTGADDQLVKTAYQGATLLIFPSFEEGFGWPLIEAMASGCPVMTTDFPPMNEVGGTSVLYIPRRPSEAKMLRAWTEEAVRILNNFLENEKSNRLRLSSLGFQNILRFDAERALDKMELIYKNICSSNI